MRKDDVALGDSSSPDILIAPFIGKAMPLGTRTAYANDANTGNYLH
jgi:hypothetical protein